MKKRMICMLLAVLIAMAIPPGYSEETQGHTLTENGLTYMKFFTTMHFDDEKVSRVLFAVCASKALAEVSVIDANDVLDALLDGNVYVASIDGADAYYFMFFDSTQTILLYCPRNFEQVSDCKYYLSDSFLDLVDDSATVMKTLTFSQYWSISFSEFNAMLKALSSAISSLN